MAKKNKALNLNQETEITTTETPEYLESETDLPTRSEEKNQLQDAEPCLEPTQEELENEAYLKVLYLNGALDINEAVGLLDSKETVSNDLVPRITPLDTVYYNNQFQCEPSQYFEYPLETGLLIFVVVRWDNVKQINGTLKKEIRPYYFINGKWVSKIPSTSIRPLYNLLELIARPEAPVLVVEGEATAEAAKLLFPDYVVTTSSGGSAAVKKTDCSPLIGRNIIISPDQGEAGKQYATAIKKECSRLGHSLVIKQLLPETISKYVIENGQIIERTDVAKKGYDLADAAKEGWNSELIKTALEKEIIFFSEVNKGQLILDERVFADEEESHDSRYKLTKNALYYLVIKKNEDGDLVQEWCKLCGYIKPISSIRSIDSLDYGTLFEFRNKDSKTQNIIIYHRQLTEDKSALNMLLDRGLEVEEVKSFHRVALTCDLINGYINSSKPQEKSIVVKRVGWHDNCYIMPRTDNHKNTYSIGNEKSTNYIYESAFSNQRRLSIKGTIQEWNGNVGKLASDNNILTFCIAASLASTLLTPLGLNGFCFHLVGGSSIGKTTALHVAGSVWGIDKLSSFRSTDNASESLCRNSNDGLLIIDELAEGDSDSVEKIAYMLGNGFGKARAKQNGDAQNVITFRILGLSTGEISLKTKLNEKKKNTTAGQSVRFVEIDADQGNGLGIFDTLHGFASAKDLANHLKEMSARYHGSLIDVFMQRLVADFDDVTTKVKMFKKQWLEIYTNGIQDGQVERVAGSFALVAAVGETAISKGVLPFAPHKVAIACGALFNNFLNKRGGVDSFEYKEIVSRLKRLVQEQINARFLNADGSDDNKTIQNLAGFKKIEHGVITEYWVNTDLFEREILENRDKRVFLPQLSKRGFILYDEENKRYTLRRKPHNEKQRRFFVVSSDAINDSEVEDGAA